MKKTLLFNRPHVFDYLKKPLPLTYGSGYTFPSAWNLPEYLIIDWDQTRGRLHLTIQYQIASYPGNARWQSLANHRLLLEKNSDRILQIESYEVFNKQTFLRELAVVTKSLVPPSAQTLLEILAVEF